MAMSYAAALKSPRMQLVSDMIAGKTPAAAIGTATAGTLVIGTSALSGATGVLATIALPTTPFLESGGVLTLQGTPLTVAASATGTASKAEFRNHAGTVIVGGLTVGTADKHVLVTSTAITAGEDVTVVGATITHS